VAVAAEMVGVPGSDVRFPATTEVAVGTQSVPVTLTGTALRRKLGFKVYAVASYVQAGSPVAGPEQLLAADAVKLLHLVLERKVDGPTLADSIRAGVKLNYPADAFAAELAQLDQALKGRELAAGQHVLLTAVPKAGLRCFVPGQTDLVIPNPAFAKAIWEIYLGRNTIDDAIKAGLTARLGR